MTRKQLHEIRLIAMYYGGDKAIDDKDALIDHIDEQQRKIDRLQEAMRNIVANDESDKYSKWPDTQYRMRSIAEAALKETSAGGA